MDESTMQKVLDCLNARSDGLLDQMADMDASGEDDVLVKLFVRWREVRYLIREIKSIEK